MTQRVLFPTDAERAVVGAFLSGRPMFNDSDCISNVAGQLVMGGAAIAWFDTAGALYASVPHGYTMHYMMKVLNAMAETLGVVARIEIEREGDISRLFFDGVQIEHGAPFVVCGGLGMSAWRASAQGKEGGR